MMETEDDETEKVTCLTDPGVNCSSSCTEFLKKYAEDTSDDSLCGVSVRSRRLKKNKKIVAAKCYNKLAERDSLSVWIQSDYSHLDSSVSSCERFSDSSAQMAKSSSKKSHFERGSPSKDSSLNVKKNVNRKMKSHDLSSSDESAEGNSPAHGNEFPNSQDHLLSSEEELGGHKEYLLSSEDEIAHRKHKKRESVSSSNSVQSDKDTHSKEEEKVRKKFKVKDRVSGDHGLSSQDVVSSEEEEKTSKYRKRKDSIHSSSRNHVVTSLANISSENKEESRKKHKRRDSVSSSSSNLSSQSVRLPEKEGKSSKKHKRRDSVSSSGSDQTYLSSQKNISVEEEEEIFKKPRKKDSISSSNSDQTGFSSPKNKPRKEDVFEKPRKSASFRNEDIGQVNRQNGCVTKYEIQNTRTENTAIKPSNLEMVYHDKRLTEEEEEKVSSYSELFGEGFLKKNNIWLLQCPRSVDCSQLVKQSLDLDDNSLMQVGDTRYETLTHRSEGEKHVSLAVPSSQHSMRITRIPITGTIVLEEYVGVGDFNDFAVPDPPEVIQFPENLRTRHPLLGLDYEKQPKTAEFIMKKQKKKKKKHSFPSDFVHVPIKVEKLDYDSMVESSLKKKKKRKRESDLSLEEANSLKEIPVQQIKTELPDVGVKVEYDSTVECTPKKSKKRKRESDISTQESELSTSEQSPKKKRKKKSEPSDEMQIKEESYEEPVSEKEEKVKKKKKKSKSEDSL